MVMYDIITIILAIALLILCGILVAIAYEQA
jgi:hypothetical protein